MFWIRKLCVAVVLWSSVYAGCAQHKPGIVEQELSVEHDEVSGDLVKLLSFIGTHYGVSISAELAQPYPENLRIAAGKQTMDQILDQIMKQCPAYAWENRNQVVWVYNKKLRLARGNFLNKTLQVFVMPDNLADLRLDLPVDIQMSEHKGGGLLAGVKPATLASIKLSPETIKNVTVREVLLRISRQAKIFSLFIFPHNNPKTEAEAQDAWANWTLVTSESLTRNPLPIRSLPAKKLSDPLKK